MIESVRLIIGEGRERGGLKVNEVGGSIDPVFRATWAAVSREGTAVLQRALWGQVLV